MAWLKPFEKILGGLNKNKDLSNELFCPWRAYCPSFVYKDKFGVTHNLDKPLPQKIKLIETPQPFVRLYECGHCGMKFFYGIEGQRIVEGEKAHLKNPGLIGGHPTW